MKRNWFQGRKHEYLFLGSLEKQVMEILWEQGALSGREIHERLSLKRQVALTTVLTVIERLVKKGLVSKGTEGKVYLFQPSLSREQWETEMSRQLLLQALKYSPRAVFSAFGDILHSLPSPEFSQILDKMKEKRDGKKR